MSSESLLMPSWLRVWIRYLIGPLLIVIVMVAGFWWFGRQIIKVVSPPPETIVSASLEGLREQNRLSAFAANYVAVVTSTQSRFGLSAQKTLIVPGLVRYEVDLSRLQKQDVRWDAQAHQLFVVLPPIEAIGPQIDITRMREYDGGGLLMRLTDAGKTLEAANRRAGQAELLRQASAPLPLQMAKDATRRAIARSFAFPLHAAGLDATVRVRFPDEPGFPESDHEQIDGSRPWRDVYGDAPTTH